MKKHRKIALKPRHTPITWHIPATRAQTAETQTQQPDEIDLICRRRRHRLTGKKEAEKRTKNTEAEIIFLAIIGLLSLAAALFQKII